MSTIDIGTSERPLSRIHSPRTTASTVGQPMAQEIDSGDFYIGSTKINTLPLYNGSQAARVTQSI